MSILPVVAREMSVLARRRSTYITRSLTAALGMFVIGWIFLVAVAGMSVAQMGQTVFMGLASLCFVYALLAGIHATSDAISEEKREGTLGLLFLTDLKSYDITLGKLAATSLSSFYALLSVIPTLAFAVLLGGVAMADVARVSLVLVNTMFLSLSLGILVSALSINERRSILTSFILLAAATIGPFILTMVLTEFEKLPAFGVCISPIYPFMCAFDPDIPDFETKLFYPSLVIQHCLAWLCLARATFLLPSLAHGVGLKWRDRLAAAFEQYAYGAADERKAHRAKLLDRNAFLWLAARERVKPLWAWAIMAVFFALYLWVAWGFRGILFDLHTSATLLFLVHLVIKLWVTSEVCTRVIQDRRSGAFELLLSSPLSIREIATGQDLALKRILAKPVLVLVLTELFLMFLALRFMNKPAPAERVLTYVAAISTLLLDLWALKWLGMWLSLFGKSIERVLVATTARIMFAPSLLFVALAALLSATLVVHGRRAEYRELLLSWWFFGVVFSVGFGFIARRNFLRHCREAVADQHESPASMAKAAFTRRSTLRARPHVPAFVLRRPVVSALTAVVILLIAGFLVRRMYWSAQLASKIEALQIRNAPTKILEVPKTYAPIPKDEDAFAELSRAGMVNRFLGRGVEWRVLHLAGSNYLHGLDATNRQHYASVLTNNQTQFSAFEKLTLYTNAYIDAVGDYRPLRTTDLYGYAELGLLELMLAADARDVPRLERALELLLHYTKLLRAQPSWYAQYAAGTLVDRLPTAFELIIYRRLLSDSSLGRLQMMTAQIDSTDVSRRLLLISRALALDPPEELRRYRFGQDKLAASITKIFSEASGVQHQQLIKVLDRFEQALAMDARSHHEQLAWASELSGFTNQGMNPPPSLQQLHDAHIRDILLRNVRIIADIRLLETILAIERYSRMHGNYPASLEALVPEFLFAPPVDPFSGTVFKWKHSSDGPMLWSVGPNGQDDDGAVGFNNSADLTFHFWSRNRE